MNQDKRIPYTLLTLRIGVFIVFFVWALDKLVNPGHAAAVFNMFYGLEGVGNAVAYTFGSLQLALVFAFLAGYKQRITYGIVASLHAVSTFVTWKQFLDPFTGINLLFFAAFPMLAAAVTLYILRDYDTVLAVDHRKAATREAEVGVAAPESSYAS